MTYRRLLLTAAATSLMLAACNPKPAGPVTGAPIASLPLAESAPPPEVAAPAASDLPPAPPIIRVSTPRQPAYSYIDDAYDLGDAFADSPPDYTVDYDGVQPWVWRSSGGDYRVVEQTSYGEREYFYHADSDYPFLIRDHDYSYAYDNGQLVEVYDSYGRPYPNYGASLLVIAAQYLFRGQHLHYAAIHDQRQAAYAADWRARQGGVMAAQQRWSSEQQSNPDWRRFHTENVQRQQTQQTSFQQERTQRQAYVQRIAPVIAAAPQAPPMRQGPPAGQRRDLAQDRGQPPAGAPQTQPGNPGPQRAQEAAANPARGEAQRQQQPQAQIQQRAQAEAANRSRDAAPRQQAAAPPQPQEQQRAQADTANRARDAAQHQQQAQAQVQNQQRAQAQAASHARDEEQRQQQGANRAQAEVAHQAQAQAMARQGPARAMAQQHQAQAQASVQQHQMAAQHAQAAQVQHAQAAAQHASPAAARPPARPDEEKK